MDKYLNPKGNDKTFLSRPESLLQESFQELVLESVIERIVVLTQILHILRWIGLSDATNVGSQQSPSAGSSPSSETRSTSSSATLLPRNVLNAMEASAKTPATPTLAPDLPKRSIAKKPLPTTSGGGGVSRYNNLLLKRLRKEVRYGKKMLGLVENTNTTNAPCNSCYVENGVGVPCPFCVTPRVTLLPNQYYMFCSKHQFCQGCGGLNGEKIDIKSYFFD